MNETLTGDYWTYSLVSSLATQKAGAPAALAFRAAQIVLGTRALFSDQLLRNLLDPPAQGTRAASEAHHLFPVAWLHTRGIGERRRVNQIANLADVGWHENSDIGGRGPAEYVPRLREKLGIDDDQWGRLCAEHALPLGWESMEYDEFLRQRRRRMADIIRVAYRQLGGERDSPHLHRPGSSRGLRPFGSVSSTPSAPYAHWPVRSTPSVSVSLPGKRLRRLCRIANARPLRAHSERALRVWTRSVS
jgi:hypothetical protein